MKVIQKENVALAGLVGTTLLAGGLLTIPGVVAGTDAVDEITITVPPSCSLSSTGGDSHTAEILNGQTNSSVGESTIKAYCNDNNGFSIYAIGYTDNELGKTVLTSSTLGSAHDILTGTNTTGNSSWAMKLSTITSPEPTYPLIIAGSVDDTDKEQGDPDYTSFQEVPDDYTLVAKRTSNTDTGENAEGATLKTTYQVHISNTQSAGTYTGQVKYTMVHPYNGEAPIKPVSLEQAYQKAGKTKYNGYYKMQDMKGSNICETANVLDDQLQVIDVRDDKVYWIAKLQDGHCWMTQNLDLNLETTPNHVATLTSENTDLNEYGSNGYTSTNGYSCSDSEASDCEGGTITWTPANSTIELNADGKTFSSMGTSGTDYNVPKSLNTGDWYYAGYDGTNLLASTTVNYLTSTNKVTTDGVTTVNDGNSTVHDYFSTAPFTGSGTSNNGEHGHVGNYYNWSASVASNDTSGFTTDTYSNGISGNPANSICPAGWRLPTTTSQSPYYFTEGSRNEYARLAKLYAGYSGSNSLSSAGLEAAPLFFARGGHVAGSSLYNAGHSAYYWSSSVYSSSHACDMHFIATTINPVYGDLRSYGLSVRCLAQ